MDSNKGCQSSSSEKAKSEKLSPWAQLERQQKEAKELHAEFKEREAKPISQLEQQQKEAKEQHVEPMKLLKHRMMPEGKPKDKQMKNGTCHT